MNKQQTEKTPTCVDCGRVRTPDDADYSPVQVVFGVALGWYSGDDGEMCGACMAAVMKGGKR